MQRAQGFTPNGLHVSSWIQPPRPLAAMAKKIMSSHTESEREGGVDVRRGDQAPFVQADRPSIAAMMSTGRKSIAFISSTQTNTVSAAGKRRSGCGRRGGKPLDLVVDELEGEFDERLALVRHAGGRSAHHPPDEADAHDTDEQRRHQRIDVQRPEAPSLTGW